MNRSIHIHEDKNVEEGVIYLVATRQQDETNEAPSSSPLTLFRCTESEVVPTVQAWLKNAPIVKTPCNEPNPDSVDGVPAHTLEAIERYVEHRSHPSGFLMALLTNDLRGAVRRADDKNKKALAGIVDYCYGNIPAVCWGSPERVLAWLRTKEDEQVVT